MVQGGPTRRGKTVIVKPERSLQVRDAPASLGPWSDMLSMTEDETRKRNDISSRPIPSNEGDVSKDQCIANSVLPCICLRATMLPCQPPLSRRMPNSKTKIRKVEVATLFSLFSHRDVRIPPPPPAPNYEYSSLSAQSPLKLEAVSTATEPHNGKRPYI